MSEGYVRCKFCDTFILLSACPKGVCSVCRYSHKKRKLKELKAK